MGPYERQKREQQRAREREARRSELVGLGTPVSQTRVAPVINRSPYEGVRIGNSQQGSYQYGKDMREKGFVERMDINGNYKWVNPKTGMQPDGSPLNPTRGFSTTRQVQGQADDLADPDIEKARDIAKSAYANKSPEAEQHGVDALGIDRGTRELMADMPAQQADDIVHNASMGRLKVHRDAGSQLRSIIDRQGASSPELTKQAQAANDAYMEYMDAVEKTYTTQYKAAKEKRNADSVALTDYLTQTNRQMEQLGGQKIFSDRYIDAIARQARGEITSEEAFRITGEEDQKRYSSRPVDPVAINQNGDAVEAHVAQYNELVARGERLQPGGYRNEPHPPGDDFSGVFVASAPKEAIQTQPHPGNQQGLTEDEKEDQAAAKGGDEDRFALSRNFLATDKVPDSIFGYPIASRREDYTPGDIEFFRAHPEAGGYYDLGEGSPEDEPVQAAGAGNTRGRYPGSLNNPGNTGKHARKDRKDWTGEIDSPHDRWAKFDTPQNGLLAAAVAMRKITDGKLKPAGQPFTIRNYAYKYVPPKENDTEAYIKNISRYAGLDPDVELDRHDVDAMARLLRAKVRFESGVPHSEWFTDGEYRSAAEALQEGSYE